MRVFILTDIFLFFYSPVKVNKKNATKSYFIDFYVASDCVSNWRFFYFSLKY